MPFDPMGTNLATGEYVPYYNPFRYMARTPTTWAATLPAGTGTLGQRQAIRSQPGIQSAEMGAPAMLGQRLTYQPGPGGQGSYRWMQEGADAPRPARWAPSSMPGQGGASYGPPSALELMRNRKRGFLPESGWYGGRR